MAVKNKVNPVEEIRDILRDQNGILLTSDLVKKGIPRVYLSVLVKNGEVQRVSRGIYSATNTIFDEMVSIQFRYKGAIYSHETALFLLDLTDRTPLFYSMTVPARYNATSLKASGVKVYFINRNLHQLGLSIKASPHGNNIKTYNLERTICDVLRSRNLIDIQLINDALKRYVGKKERNLNLLYEYAKQFRIQRIVREIIEVLL